MGLLQDLKKAEYQRRYREANAEKAAAYRRAHYQKNKERIKARNRQYYQDNKEKISAYQREYRAKGDKRARAVDQRRRSLETRYGITLEQYDQMFLDQKGRCGICEAFPSRGKPLAVDHCHGTGKVRGLLCFPCNSGLGKLGDCIEGLERALKYLKETID